MTFTFLLFSFTLSVSISHTTSSSETVSPTAVRRKLFYHSSTNSLTFVLFGCDLAGVCIRSNYGNLCSLIKGFTFLPPYVPLCDRFCKRRGLDCDDFISWRTKTSERKCISSLHTTVVVLCIQISIEIKGTQAETYCRLQMS